MWVWSIIGIFLMGVAAMINAVIAPIILVGLAIFVAVSRFKKTE